MVGQYYPTPDTPHNVASASISLFQPCEIEAKIPQFNEIIIYHGDGDQVAGLDGPNGPKLAENKHFEVGPYVLLITTRVEHLCDENCSLPDFFC